MHEAIANMLSRYNCRSSNDSINALREIIQEVSLLGLWRGKFFQQAAFYGGSALRIIYGLDRFSEDMDFSLLKPRLDFDISSYATSLQKECEAFGFEVRFEKIEKAVQTPIKSAFLKANTRKQLLVIETSEDIIQNVPKGKLLKIKIELDTDPPSGFITETKYILRPIPFTVKALTLPDLFAGKMHAVLCRRWKNRIKGRDWYDLVWYAANHPELHISHLEQRMRQTQDWEGENPLTKETFQNLLIEQIKGLDISKIRGEVEPFVKTPENLNIWSREFFWDVISRIEII
jgi:predicted nucleotidyltransferase component of viral defense system